MSVMKKVLPWLAVLLVVAACAWWIVSPRIELHVQRADTAEQQLAQAQLQIELQAQVLEGHHRQQERLAELDRQIRQMGQTIATNARQHGRALEELKRNDETISDYLRTAVPTDLGLLYARPNTTDPAAYRAAGDVQPGAVPTTGPLAAGGD
ncbi:MAG: hypothetical protein CVV07_07455 [Gammaproteobacteria bacterium HGW-Gammaproteobacteria-11]|nr:MAG: hypothetical protein CVV07_07455 [Gammaproteobacteria bacterium HGW-Gammaproteobacteria-11]